MLLKTHLHSSFLPVPLLSHVFVSVSQFFFLSTESCHILCIFKQLIRVLLCFYSRSYQYCCRRCCCCSRCCYLRKSFYQKRHFFVTRNDEKQYDTVCAAHGAPLCHVCSVTSRERKRRSWANFRSRYITRKWNFLGYVLDLGLANDMLYIETRPHVTLNACMDKKKMYTIQVH